MTTIEELAGVPSAAELARLANEMFPDLTEGATMYLHWTEDTTHTAH